MLLAWGGHLAQSRYWNMAAGGPRDGAGEVSGAPWHMRTLQLDGSGNRNQDRSIQPSAIVGELGPRALAPPTPTPRPTPVPRAVVPPPAPKPTPRPPTAGGIPTRRTDPDGAADLDRTDVAWIVGRVATHARLDRAAGRRDDLGHVVEMAIARPLPPARPVGRRPPRALPAS